MTIKIPISSGELIDKITILEIKSKYVNEENKLGIIYTELEILHVEFEKMLSSNEKKRKKIKSLKDELEKINSELWVIEDKIRILESKKDFSDKFVKLARNVYFYNDKRSDIKNKINVITDSNISEVKQYPDYNKNE